MALVRTRIAPSPTGYLHIGTARTALFNYLFTKRRGGTFVLRIEDTDIERSKREYEEEILESLEWLGITADESPERGGEYGPYRQSERIASYRPYLEKLLASGWAYHCPHTEAELEAEQQARMAAGKNPIHACEHRDGGTVPPSRNTIIRFKTSPGRDIAFTDLIRGEISFRSDLLGDFSIAKDLSIPLYNFAVTIDDHEMRISHVIRGEDHISNTPKQLLIAHALGFPPPAYAHLPLILGPDRSKLSKRHGATAIREFRGEGYLAGALVNYMALLGWNPAPEQSSVRGEPRAQEREVFSLQELTELFSLEKVHKAGAVFSTEKLNWMNGEYIRRSAIADLIPAAAGFLPGFSPSDVEGALRLEQSRIQKLGDLREHIGYLKEDPEYPPKLLAWKQMTAAEIRSSLERSRTLLGELPADDFTKEKIEAHFLSAIGAGDKGMLLWPLRVALTGQKASAGPFEIMAVLGKDRSRQRIERALKKIPA